MQLHSFQDTELKLCGWVEDSMRLRQVIEGLTILGDTGGIDNKGLNIISKQGRLHHGGSGGGCPPCPLCTGAARGQRNAPFLPCSIPF